MQTLPPKNYLLPRGTNVTFLICITFLIALHLTGSAWRLNEEFQKSSNTRQKTTFCAEMVNLRDMPGFKLTHYANIHTHNIDPLEPKNSLELCMSLIQGGGLAP